MTRIPGVSAPTTLEEDQQVLHVRTWSATYAAWPRRWAQPSVRLTSLTPLTFVKAG